MKNKDNSQNNLSIEKYKIILVIAVFAVCFIGSAIVMVKSFNNDDKKDLTQTEQEMQEITNEKIEDTDFFTDEEKSALSEEDKLNFAMGDYTQKYNSALKLGEDSNIEYPESESDRFYKDLLSKAQSSQFNEIITMIDEKAYTYKFHEEYNWKIGDLYYDSMVLIASLEAPIEGKGHMIKNLKDPNMLVIGTLLIPEESRRAVISSKESLSPIFSGNVKLRNNEVIEIMDAEKNEDVYLRECYNNTLGVYRIHKITLEIEQKSLNAYILEFEDGSYEFYTLQKDGDYECSYRTIQYWLDIDSLFGDNPINIYDREESELPNNADVEE